MDEIVSRVVDQLSEAGVGDADDEDHEIEVREVDEEEIDEEGFDEEEIGVDDDREGHDHGTRDDHAHRPEEEEARRQRENARERKREAKRRARDAREATAGLDDLGDRIEAAVEAQLDHVAEHIEHSLPMAPESPPAPTMPGVVIGPDDTRDKAVYKTQLQKGGRVAIPDTEIEALDLEPGDTLQVVIYPVE